MARLERITHDLEMMRKARADLGQGFERALQRQRAISQAEHTIDRKVWAIERAEAEKYIASILEWARTSETYAKSLEAQVAWLGKTAASRGVTRESAAPGARSEIAVVEPLQDGQREGRP